MTPVYMNPSPSSSSSSFPLLEMKKDHQQSQLKIFLTSHQASSTSKFLPCSSNQDQHASATLDKATAEHLMHGELSDRPDSISAASSSLQILSGPQGIHHLQGQDSINSSVLVSEARSPDHQQTHGDVDAKDIYGAKWMPSKMRFIQKMRSDSGFTTRGTTDEFSADNSTNNNLSEMGFSGSNASNSATRVCSDCNTTTTPLWRSGPRGPKSLCNACGIRRRKARRAMEEAANATVGAAGTATELSSPRANTKAGIYNKEKKPRPNHQHHHAPHYRKQAERCRPGMDINGSDTSFLHHGQKKLNLFKNLGIGLSENIGGSGFGRVFPQDETEAAIMLMELSCGLIHT